MLGRLGKIKILGTHHKIFQPSQFHKQKSSFCEDSDFITKNKLLYRNMYKFILKLFKKISSIFCLSLDFFDGISYNTINCKMLGVFTVEVKVVKFGGSSLANANQFKKVASCDCIRGFFTRNHDKYSFVKITPCYYTWR